jgi:protease IV
MSEWKAGDRPGWERESLERLLHGQLIEQRRARRWNLLFKFLVLLYLFLLLFLVRGADLGVSDWLDRSKESERHVAVVDIEGLIASAANANAEDINKTLRKAFADADTAAVMLRINSGGGSPVQAGQIHDELKRLRAKHPDIPLHAVIADVGASGAYYIAVAADQIHANQASIVGSIGVRLDSFGLVGLMERWGVERRLFTAGENKGFLDPFLPLQTGEVQHVEAVLGEIHQQFIDVVEAGRGERLRDRETVFSGLIWTGAEALELGLVDGLGDDRSVAREVIGVERLVVFKPKRTAFQQLLDDLGVVMGNQLRNWQQLPQWR